MKKIFALSKADKNVISQNIHGTPAIEQEKDTNPTEKKVQHKSKGNLQNRKKLICNENLIKTISNQIQIKPTMRYQFTTNQKSR